MGIESDVHWGNRDFDPHSAAVPADPRGVRFRVRRARPRTPSRPWTAERAAPAAAAMPGTGAPRGSAGRTQGRETTPAGGMVW